MSWDDEDNKAIQKNWHDTYKSLYLHIYIERERERERERKTNPYTINIKS